MKKNRLGYPVLPDEMHKTLFGDAPRVDASEEMVANIRHQYQRFELPFPVETAAVPDYKFQMPDTGIEYNNVEEFFERVGAEFAKPMDARLRALYAQDLPAMPAISDIVRKAGWYRYAPGQAPQLVDAPLEDTFVFDCETLVTRGNFPIIATAASAKAWYIWLAPEIENPDLPYQTRLFPLGKGKLGVAHNASFDFSRTCEHRNINTAPEDISYFFDTMSAHIVTAGYGGPQRAALTTGRYFTWADKGCKNSLLACYNFYTWPLVPLTQEDKATRDLFVTAPDCSYIVAQFDKLIEYALLDVHYLFEMARVQYPRYREARPSWVSLAGMLQQSTFHMPVKDDWFEWIDRVEQLYHQYEEQIDRQCRDYAKSIATKYKEAYEALPIERVQELYRNPHDNDGSANELAIAEVHECPWLSTFNWQIKPRAKVNRGWPEWYRRLPKLTSKNRITHMLLKLRYRGQPILYRKGMGFCYQDEQTLQWNRVPRSKPGNVAVVLCKDFKDQFASGEIHSDDPHTAEILRMALSSTYWTSTQKRVKQQLVARGTNNRGKDPLVVSPGLVVHGTISGRSVEPLWLTVSDIKAHKLGTEIKSRFQPAEGYKLVQADMSGQELRYFAALADAKVGVMGSTIVGFNVMAGNKENGTDPHTKLANRYKIGRADAKTAYYALIYGAGKKTIAWPIYYGRGGKSSMSECQKLAADIIFYRKGKKIRGTNKYAGGTDSEGFTHLEEIGTSRFPRTPVLNSRMTAPQCPAYCGNNFHTGRINWVVQAGARDQLDCFIVLFNYLARYYGLDARVVWSFHDEYVAHVAEEDCEKAVWLYNVAHAYTWALLSYKLGLNDLCMVNTFFDDVFVNSAFTKNANLDGKYTQTLSNPDEALEPTKVYTVWDLAEQQMDKLL